MQGYGNFWEHHVQESTEVVGEPVELFFSYFTVRVLIIVHNNLNCIYLKCLQYQFKKLKSDFSKIVSFKIIFQTSINPKYILFAFICNCVAV